MQTTSWYHSICAMMFVHLVLFINVFCPLVTARLVLTASDNQTLEVPTYDYYTADYSKYDVNGQLAYPKFDTEKVCQLLAPNAQATGTIARPELTDSSPVVALNWTAAKAAGCNSISHAARAAHDYGRALSETGMPSPEVVVILLTNPRYYMYSGSPNSDPYRSDSFSISDETPSFATALVPVDDTQRVDAFLQANSQGPIRASVTQELGPWNEVILSPVNIALRLILFVLVLYGIVQLGLSFYRKEFTFDRRNTLFIIALCASILGSPHPLMHQHRLVDYLYLALCSTMLSLCTYSLVLLWCSLLTAIQHSRKPWALLIMTYFSMAVSVFIFCIKCWVSFRPQEYAGLTSIVIIAYMLAALHISICALFICYSYLFSRRRLIMSISKKTAAPLLQISHVAAVCFVSFFFVEAAMITTVTQRIHMTPFMDTLVFYFRAISWTIESGAFLVVLGVRKKQTTEPASKLGGSILNSYSGGIIYSNPKAIAQEKDFISSTDLFSSGIETDNLDALYSEKRGQNMV